MKKCLALALSLCLAASMSILSSWATYLEDDNHFTGDTVSVSTDSGPQNAGINASTVTDSEIASQDVTVKLQTSGSQTTTHVYAISYSATELTFTYQQGGSRTWNPEKLQYDIAGDGGQWNAQTQAITVTNYSDLPVDVTAAVGANTIETGNVTVTAEVTGQTGVSTLALASAYDGGTTGTAKSGTFDVKIDGKPSTEYLTASELVKLTLTVAKHEEP